MLLFVLFQFLLLAGFVQKASGALACATGYTMFDSHCYKFSASNQVLRSDCSTLCTTDNANMACIQNLSQHNYIWTTGASNAIWVGIYRVSNVFTWPSECASSYTNFASGEGNMVSELSAIMYSGYGGQWADVSEGSWSAKCVCQKEQFELVPSSQPTGQPSRQPSRQPSSQPSGQPAANPSSQPSVQYDQSIESSPTYTIKNGFAFAVIDSNGTVYTWGEDQYGGDSSSVQHLLNDVAQVVPARFSFIALKNNGSVVSWGESGDQQGFHGYNEFSDVRSIAASESAYAVVATSTGAVSTYGARHGGGETSDASRCAGCSAALAAGVEHVIASVGAFAAIKTDGTVFAWGNPLYGAVIPATVQALLHDVVKIVASREAFAALTHSGRVLTWGSEQGGGDSSRVAHLLDRWVTHISASRSGFVAFRKDSQVAVWGHPEYMNVDAVASQVATDVIFVAHTFTASAAVKADGTVVTWGAASGGGDSSAASGSLVDVVKVFATSKAFAALKSDGSVVTWGKAAYGGQIPSNKVSALSSGVVSIYHTDRAFAAMKSDGAVVVWGQAGHGGSPGAAVEAHLVSGVHTICANDVAFSVIKTDGSVVGWGHPVSVSTAGVLFTSSGLGNGATCA